MAERYEDIDRFIGEVRKRMNRHLGLDLLIHGLCAAGGILTGIGLGCLVTDCRVPLFWYPIVLILTGAGTFGVWLYGRRSLDQATLYIDAHFRLKDAVRSYRGFSKAHHHGGLYDLQADQTQAVLADVSVTDVKVRWPIRRLIACMVLMVSSLWLTLRADPPKDVQASDTAEQIQQQTEQLNAQIKEALEQIQEQVRAEEIEKQIAPEELQRMADVLKGTGDLKDALRQYSRLETQLDQVVSKLERRKDEQLYKKMGEALQKHDPAKALGQDLAQRQYKEAAQELQKLKMDKGSSTEHQREQLEQIKGISQRMANEAKQQNASSNAATLAQRLDKAAGDLDQALSRSGKDSGSQSPNGSGQNSQGSGSQGSGSQGSGSQGSGSEGDSSEGSGSEGSEGSVNEALSEMAKDLRHLDAQSKARSAIQQLCKSLSECQGKMCDGSGNCSGQGSGQGNGGGNGGRDPGTGSSSNVNTHKNQASSTGDRSLLKGIKGQGPSVKTTEAAPDGSGGSSAPRPVLIQQYQRQGEAFIRREDVPESVKSGVKAYFEGIHKTEEGN